MDLLAFVFTASLFVFSEGDHVVGIQWLKIVLNNESNYLIDCFFKSWANSITRRILYLKINNSSRVNLSRKYNRIPKSQTQFNSKPSSYYNSSIILFPYRDGYTTYADGYHKVLLSRACNLNRRRNLKPNRGLRLKEA